MDTGTAHLCGVVPVRGHGFVVGYEYPAGRDPCHAREKPERRESRQALPASALADQAGAGAWLHVQIYGADHITIADGNAKALNLQSGHLGPLPAEPVVGIVAQEAESQHG
jgi:hypothetical protein